MWKTINIEESELRRLNILKAVKQLKSQSNTIKYLLNYHERGK